jgi:hypothetical protein
MYYIWADNVIEKWAIKTKNNETLELDYLTKEYQPEEFRKKDNQSIEKSHLLEVMTNKKYL